MANILHVSSNAAPPLDVEHSTKKIWKELASGFDEYHILARAEDNRFHSYREGNIYMHLVPNLFKTYSFFLTSFAMFPIVKKHKIDVILCQCPIFGGFTAAIVNKLYNTPFMVEIHGMIYFEILDGRRFIDRVLSKIIRYSFRKATKIRTLNEKMTEMLDRRGVIGSKTEIYNRVNTTLFAPPKTSFELNAPIRIVSVGRFVWEKAYDIAIKAVIELNKKYNIELILIGGGPKRREYDSIIGKREYFELYDWLPQEEFVHLLHDADIYIQPSVSEGMPRTILEAMAMRLPIIASDAGVIAGTINNGENGILIKKNSIEELQTAIELLINDKELRERIAHKAYDDAINKYEWGKMFEKHRQELIEISKR